MSKKGFNENPALAFISNTQNALVTPNTQDTHKTQRVQKRARINMAFDDDNLEFLQIVSRIDGISITQAVNDMVREYHSKRKEEINKIKEYMK